LESLRVSSCVAIVKIAMAPRMIVFVIAVHQILSTVRSISLLIHQLDVVVVAVKAHMIVHHCVVPHVSQDPSVKDVPLQVVNKKL
jgi:hypothetical protein